MATIEERFQAAINVIKGLPKNGPYQPSTGMMLKFYGYFKQATEGACRQKKPAFWDIVGKAKWDAWMSNKHLTKEQAMQKYVDELREIIETMSFTENVQNFVGSINGLDSINLDELDLIAPGVRELAESHPDSPFNSRTNSPQHGLSTYATNGATSREELNTATSLPSTSSTITAEASSSSGPIVTKLNGAFGESSTSIYANSVSSHYTAAEPMTNGIVDQSDDEYDDPVDIQSDLTEAMAHNSEVLKQVQATVLRMNADIVTVNQRMSLLEKSLLEVRHAVQKPKATQVALRQRYPKWWPFTDISPSWFMLLVVWPFFVSRMSRMLSTPRRK